LVALLSIRPITFGTNRDAVFDDTQGLPGRLTAMRDEAVIDVIDLLGMRSRRITTLKDVPLENASWLVETVGGESFVLRRYHARATPEDLAYEHAVLRHLSNLGWAVPDPVGELVWHQGSWYCPTRYVPGHAVPHESSHQRRQRGRDLARLHLALRGLGRRLGQRHGWRAQHSAVSVHTDINWEACVAAFTGVNARFAAWAVAAAAETQTALAAVGAEALPVMVVHGDFAEWNVHYNRDRLAGVIDFGLTHLDSRPYELAIARCYRSPETIDAYQEELTEHRWPITELEESAIEPINHAFRVDMVAWQLDQGQRTGAYDLVMIERQLSMTGTAPP
jgi:homoserine kinase type II